MRVRVGSLTTAVLVLALPLTVSACGADGSTSSSGSSSASPTIAFTTLPDSALTTIEGVTYVQSAASDKALATTHVGQTLSAFTGGISRDMVVGGETVGGVQVYRFASDIATSARQQFVPMMIYTATTSTPHPSQVGGKVVQVVDARPTDGAAVVGWTQEDQVVLLWAQDLSAAKEYAGKYVLDSFAQ